MSVLSYIESNKERFIEELFSLMRIPSVSAQPHHHADMERCAAHWAELLVATGADRAEVMPTDGNPVVFGSKTVDPSAPTVLIYSHYDVMPAEPLDRWDSQPFEPVIRDGRIWGRGADDDKGQGMIQVKGFETALRTGGLKCNVKFLFEGEEEIGSGSLEAFCRSHRELLKADVILVSDTSMVSRDTPSLTTGLRGLGYWELTVTGPNRDLHSGIFGGAVANPINMLCKLIADVLDDKGRITIPGFYDDVERVSDHERQMLAEVPFDEAQYCRSVGVRALQGEAGYTTLERTAIRPTFDVCGIWGGYMEEGAKTVLPSKASAKLSCRLVPNQDYKKIMDLVADYFYRAAPESVTVEIQPLHGGDAYVCPITLPAYQAAERAYEKTFGKRPLALRRGGSIPIISTFERVLDTKTVLMSFGLESDAIHSPNENYPVELFLKGVETVAEFYHQYPVR